ncbi:MAG: alanine racemase [Deltaproteobacteria bacterium]|nr:alanine racemase [Deltaproteobacteria bacterium]
MSNPRLRIDLEKITHNARRALEIGRAHGVEVMGVTKGAAGNPPVAKAMLAGGIESLADSRLDNIARLRADGIQAPITLLRSPGPSDVARTVELADASLNSDVVIVEALSIEARVQRKIHGVILMVDLHTGREGLPPEKIPAACRKLQSLPGIQLKGIGAYFHLASGNELHIPGLQAFVHLAKEVEKGLGKPLSMLSGGSSNILRTLAVEGHPNPGINHLRIGTVILLGFASSLNPITIDGLERDTFILQVEVIEVKQGQSGESILALGKVDTDPQFLFPVEPGVTVGDASSDHLMVRMDPSPSVGDRISFRLGYPALCRLMVSPYVQVEYVKMKRNAEAGLIAKPSVS